MHGPLGGYYLESEHLGHTSAFNEKSGCVDATVEEFLVNGMQPLRDNCPAD